MADEYIKMFCPFCNGSFEFPENGLGETAACPHCGRPVLLAKSEASRSLQVESSIMSDIRAREIVSKFGDIYAELFRYDRCPLDRREKGLPFSLPIERLDHSKQQIQVAIAILIAELVIKPAVTFSENDARLLFYAAYCSGGLAHFTRKPMTSKENLLLEFSSLEVYRDWKQKCVLCLDKVARRTKERLWIVNQYWKSIDCMIPDLLNDGTLIAIRET